MSFGEYLKKCRGERSLGQLSEYSDIDKSYLSKIERNERKPKPEMLKKLADAYKTDYLSLMILCGYIDKEPLQINREFTEEEIKLIKLFVSVPSENQGKLLSLIEEDLKMNGLL